MTELTTDFRADGVYEYHILYRDAQLAKLCHPTHVVYNNSQPIPRINDNSLQGNLVNWGNAGGPYANPTSHMFPAGRREWPH